MLLGQWRQYTERQSYALLRPSLRNVPSVWFDLGYLFLILPMPRCIVCGMNYKHFMRTARMSNEKTTRLRSVRSDLCVSLELTHTTGVNDANLSGDSMVDLLSGNLTKQINVVHDFSDINCEK